MIREQRAKPIVELKFKEIAAIGFWRMGATNQEIALILDLEVVTVERIIFDYQKKPEIRN